MPTRTAIRPAANVRWPHQSSDAGLRTPSSRSYRYDQMVPRTPNGTETRKTKRQLIGPSKPPSTSPTNEPAIAATWFSPSASPRSFAGKASVRIALELANSMAPPTPCSTRIPISHQAAAVPCSQVTDSSTEKTAKSAKPRLNIRTRPNMSPSRPKLTTSTAVTTRYPMSSHSSSVVLPGCSGLTPIPRKMSGSAISMIDELTVAIITPSVVLDRAIHLYRGPTAWCSLLASGLVLGCADAAGTRTPSHDENPAALLVV